MYLHIQQDCVRLVFLGNQLISNGWFGKKDLNIFKLPRNVCLKIDIRNALKKNYFFSYLAHSYTGNS